MKLRNKKTGEIVEPRKIGFEIYSFNEYNYNTLADLSEEWEDYKEHTYYYCITMHGVIKSVDVDSFIDKFFKEIGNYFENKEEAEKAVEKLKAWKRLKDKGFKFTGYDTNHCHHRASFIFEKEAWATETEPDLDLLFGGEE